jgi:uncharacterized protein (DUF342 family)
MRSFSLVFQLSYDEPDRILRLNMQPAFDAPPITRELIAASLSASEFSEFYIYESTLEALALDSVDLLEKGQKLYEEYINKLEKLNETKVAGAEDSTLEEQADSDPSVAKDEDNEKTKTGSIEASITPETILELLGEQNLDFDIAECRDSAINFNIEDDDLNAYLSVVAPFGGDAATEESVLAAMNKKGIEFGIDKDAITKALERKHCDNILVAVGVKPKKGRDTRFESLVSEQISSGPKIDEKGKANFHDINEFVIVAPGDKLMKRSLPGKGKPGTDVFGKVISPIPGDILPFSANSYGSAISDKDQNLLLATEKGHPVITDRGVSVSQVLMLNNVGLSTGNVDFDGSVCVNEDVADGVTIEATGDVTVKGVVGKAKIIAGGNIVILQGLIGGSKTIQSPDEQPYGAEISAKGSVSAHFVTRSKIRAKESILVVEYVSHSDLYADKQILVGQESGKGNLFGGQARAFDLVAAKVIGSTGGTPTSIQVGAEGDNIVKLRRISKDKRINGENTYDVNEALHKLSLLAKSAGTTPQMKEKIEELNKKLESLRQALLELKQREDTLKIILVKSKKSRVIANHKIYNNASISILGSSIKITEETTGGKFRFDARKIVLER